MSNFRSRWISQADPLVAWTTDCVKRASTLRGDDGKRAEEEFRRAAAMSSRAGQKGETSFSIGLSDMHSLMAPRRSLSPRVYLLCNRCAIRTDDATIFAPLARSGDSNSRPKLRARLARPFPRLPRFAWGREKRERRPLPCLSLPSLSLSALHLHQLLTGCRARRAGQCCYHGDEEEGSRHFWGECYQDSSMTGGSQRRR